MKTNIKRFLARTDRYEADEAALVELARHTAATQSREGLVRDAQIRALLDDADGVWQKYSRRSRCKRSAFRDYMSHHHPELVAACGSEE